MVLFVAKKFGLIRGQYFTQRPWQTDNSIVASTGNNRFGKLTVNEIRKLSFF
jgi:hypothetical protein